MSGFVSPYLHRVSDSRVDRILVADTLGVPSVQVRSEEKLTIDIRKGTSTANRAKVRYTTGHHAFHLLLLPTISGCLAAIPFDSRPSGYQAVRHLQRAGGIHCCFTFRLLLWALHSSTTQIGDRLCCSFGQDILESFFSKATIANMDGKRSRSNLSVDRLRPLPHFLLALIYVFGHTLVLFYQMVTLNVAINSHNNALLTLLVSNQFVEIKGSVFKKFEKENLFQLSCSDIVERFQVTVFLSIITVRNLLEFSFDSAWLSFPSLTSIGSILEGFKSLESWDTLARYVFDSVVFPLDALVHFPVVLFHFLMGTVPSFIYSAITQPFVFNLDISSYLTLMEALVYPLLIVFGSEVIVDWLKHAFITKFNQIRPTVYSRYLEILCKDFVTPRSPPAKLNAIEPESREFIQFGNSAVVARRIGFASLPLACLVIRIASQGFMVSPWSACPVRQILIFDLDSGSFAVANPPRSHRLS